MPPDPEIQDTADHDSVASLLAHEGVAAEASGRSVRADDGCGVAGRTSAEPSRPRALPDVTAPETPVRAWMRRLRTRPRPWDYCWLTARMNLAVLRRALAGLPLGARVVDIGCGAKPFAELLAGTDHFGVDFDGRTAADLVHDLGTPLPLPDGEADLVLLSEVLEHVPDPELVLAEAARLLKPGGQLFLSAPFAFPIHGRPWDYRRFTNYYFESVGAQLPLELLELEASNNVFTTPLQLVNQLLLSTPGLPRFVKSAGWLALNLVSGVAELALRPWWRGDGRLGLFLRMNPSGYAARWSKRTETRD